MVVVVLLGIGSIYPCFQVCMFRTVVSFTSFAKFISKYSIIFYIIVNWDCFLSLSDAVLLVHRNTSDFYLDFVSCNFTEIID